MQNFKEFQGKTLDDAIQEACSYFGAEREKLEVEIINDAKTGIFGLVSVKKATIRARKVVVASMLISDVAEEQEEPKKKNSPPRTSKPKKKEEAVCTPSDVVSCTEKPASQKTPTKKSITKQAVAVQNIRQDVEQLGTEAQLLTTAAEQPSAESAQPKQPTAPAITRGKAPRKNTSPVNGGALLAPPDNGDFLPEVDLQKIAPEELTKVVQEALFPLVTPIVGEVPLEVAAENGRIRVHVQCEEASGLLVGREGQTLASLQYLAARIIGKKLGGSVRLHIDAGNYRERQDSKLTELALSLAEKVKSTGKAQSTRLLSAYQRRIIHLTLENDTDIQTLSKGEGSQRRVIIIPRRKNSQDTPAEDHPTSSLADTGSDLPLQDFIEDEGNRDFIV